LGRRSTCVLAALLAGCQPLPHPFADDRPPAALLRVPDSAGVAIVPIEGQPTALAVDLAAATARALLRHEIPASDKTSGRTSYQLYGRIAQSPPKGGKSALTVVWRLYDPKGRVLGERESRTEASTADWRAASAAIVERLAASSAEALAPLLIDGAAPKLAALQPPVPGTSLSDVPPPPPPKPPVPEVPSAKPAAPHPAAQAAPQKQTGPIRVALRRVTGAPGDGGAALAKALTNVLRQQDLTIVDAGGKADLYIEGEVAVAPAAADKQHVKIVWRVRTASGAEIGTVGQENDVPRRFLSGGWGDLAPVIALAAGDGVAQLVARGISAPKAGANRP
jgi:hypothetical protein